MSIQHIKVEVQARGQRAGVGPNACCAYDQSEVTANVQASLQAISQDWNSISFAASWTNVVIGQGVETGTW